MACVSLWLVAHVDEFPDVAIGVLESVLVHEAVILRLARGLAAALGEQHHVDVVFHDHARGVLVAELGLEAEAQAREEALRALEVDLSCHGYFLPTPILRMRSIAGLSPKSSSSKYWRTSISASPPSIAGLG